MQNLEERVYETLVGSRHVMLTMAHMYAFIVRNCVDSLDGVFSAANNMAHMYAFIVRNCVDSLDGVFSAANSLPPVFDKGETWIIQDGKVWIPINGHAAIDGFWDRCCIQDFRFKHAQGPKFKSFEIRAFLIDNAFTINQSLKRMVSENVFSEENFIHTMNTVSIAGGAKNDSPGRLHYPNDDGYSKFLADEIYRSVVWSDFPEVSIANLIFLSKIGKPLSKIGERKFMMVHNNSDTAVPYLNTTYSSGVNFPVTISDFHMRNVNPGYLMDLASYLHSVREGVEECAKKLVASEVISQEMQDEAYKAAEIWYGINA